MSYKLKLYQFGTILCYILQKKNFKKVVHA